MAEIGMKDLIAATKKNAEGLASLNKTVSTVVDRLSKTRADGHDPRQVFGIINGESPNTSRGFSFMKMLGLVTGAVKPENARVECDIHSRLHKLYGAEAKGMEPYNYSGRSPGESAFLAPLGTTFLHQELVPATFRKEMRECVNAGVDTADPDEMKWIRTKQLQGQGYGQKTLSWLNELTGGALVAPPEQGELIELLRNKEALVNAGARTVPLPPQGRLKYPRQTAAGLTYWVGENSPITASDIGTGDVTLQAKKLAVLMRMPQELLRFASPAAEALVRDDMTKDLALGLDLACLEGLGGDTRPRGILNHPDIYRITSSDPRPNGDAIVGQDIYRMVAAVEEANATFEGWIMRPKTLFKYYQLRADAVGQGDAKGPFLFNLIREAGDGVLKPTIAGYPVTKSTQVSQSQTKGNNSNLTYILGGMFSDCLIGMFGAIEFSATTQSDTAFINDQTWVKGILSADFAIRHEAAFVLMQNLDTTA